MPLDNRGDGEEIDSSDNHDDDDDEGSDGEDDDDEDSESNDDDLGMNDEEEEVEDETMEKFIRTFHNGDYDTKIEDVLSSDRTLHLQNTRPTHASYNKHLNWVERNRIGLENIIQHLQTCIDSVTRDNSFYLNLTHNPILMDNEEPIVWHEPILDEYWGRLEAEID